MRLDLVTRACAVIAVFAFAATALTGTAAALESPPEPDWSSDTYVPREMKRQLKERRAREEKRKSPEAREERRASRLKYRDKSKHEALAVARAKFEKLFAMPPWAGLDLDPGQKVKEYVDDFQALLQVGDKADDTAVVQSTLPLLNEDKQPTDLALEPQGEGFAPKAAVVELDIPADVGDGITLGGGKLSVVPVTDAATEAIETDDKVFYANAATDTDILVLPTVRGVETFHQLRSAESPEEHAFDLEVPGGASLRFGSARGPDPEDRGIEVVSPGGVVIARVSPPAAWDADREPVDVDYALDGKRVTMKVAHRDRDVAYPVMVDPEEQLEDFRWREGNRDTYGWSFGSTGNCQWNGYFGQGWWTYGFIAYHNNGVWCNDGELSQWLFQAPRMSYIYRAEFHYESHPYRYTCLVNGLWNAWGGNWDGNWAWVHCADRFNQGHGHCPVHNYCDVNNGAPSNIAVFRVQAQYSGPRNPGAWAELGGSTLFLRDREHPVIDATNHNTDSRWYRSGTMTVAPRAHDDGLGMNKFQLHIPGFVDDYRRHPCIRSRCPGPWSLPNDGQGIFSYNIPDIPNGINSVTLNARDALDKTTGSNWSINVDDEEPWLNVYGELRDAVYASPWSGSKTLWINATDGIHPYDNNPRNARAGITAVDIYVDGIKKHSQTQNCYSNCRLDFTWTMQAHEYALGNHNIRVVARDGAGNEKSSTTWQVYTTPTNQGGEDRGDETGTPAEDTLVPGDAVADTCSQEDSEVPVSTCGDSTLEDAARSEGSLASTDTIGLAKINPGAAGNWNWGFADQGGFGFEPNPDEPNKADEPLDFNRGHMDDPRFQRLHVKKLRVYIPWDAVASTYGDGTAPGRQTKYKWREAGNPTPVEKDLDPDPPVVAGDERSATLAYFDRYMGRIAELMNKPHDDPNRIHELVLAIYTTERDYNGLELGPRALPSYTQYLTNVQAIVNRYRSWPFNIPPEKLRYIEAFNEPNHRSYAPSGIYSFPGETVSEQMRLGAKHAANYYNKLRQWCRDGGGNCVPVAGSFVDQVDLTDRRVDKTRRYIYWYKRYLFKESPAVWAYHPYNAGTDIRWDSYPNKADSRRTPRMLREFLDETKPASGQKASAVWFTEVGPLYAGVRGNNRSPQCKAITNAEEKRVCQWNVGNDQLKFLMDLTNESSRIKRFYYYAFRGVGIDPNNPGKRGHDSGLLDPLREIRRTDNRGTPDTADDVWVREYPRERQIRPAYCTYGAAIDPDFTFNAEPGSLRACPYTAQTGD